MKYIMSLGSDCSVALYLRDKNLRKFAYPLDWCVTPIDSVANMFKTNFQYFLQEENLVFLESVHRKAVNDENVEGELIDDIVTPAYCKRYNMLIPHDFSAKGRDDFFSVREKYDKRIKRLLSQLDEKDSEFIFVANNAPTSPNSWRASQYQLVSGNTFINNFDGWKEKLSKVLSTVYPNLKYQLFDLKEFKQI